DTFSIYVQDQIEFTPEWKALVGVRWDHYDARAYSTGLGPGVLSTGPYERTDRMWSGRAGLIWQPTARQSWYLAWGNAYNPSGELGVYGGTGNTNLNPVNQGVTPNQLAWMFYGTDFSDGRMIWLDAQGRLAGNFAFPYRNSRLMAVGEKGEAYLCGPTVVRIVCVMAMPGASDAVWSADIDAASKPIGGALVPGALYVAADGDSLYALSVNEGE
ncbi:MAG: TonB-dependent receptor, partial [Anaerolineales bacterium]|nr:TonB-dependent receptor [Anaerolineales bacterium]